MCEYITSSSRQWAFTCRRTTSPAIVTREQYVNHLQTLTDKMSCKIIDFVFETTGGLHMHGIIEIPKAIDPIRFRVRGWHWYMEELYNEDGWRYYMLKEQRVKHENEQYQKQQDAIRALIQASMPCGTQNSD